MYYNKIHEICHLRVKFHILLNRDAIERPECYDTELGIMCFGTDVVHNQHNGLY